ncbi:hypothetical protein LG296_20875 (plasmid) [Ureibacillus chungkukjangi]|uniref:hypothetical protein n=1 Tax=Ureibacillus chungkukjangi TaxID=1202712 RepID=UPI000D3DA081|nr:hypothetical protein [Ureibacillus chungkukjangi]MCM3390009.1 hypothetical protein [Ureibacillus chungkukjangi]
MTTTFSQDNLDKLLALSVNNFGITQVKQSPYLQYDQYIRESTEHRVYTIEVTETHVVLFNFELGRVIRYRLDEILSYQIDNDWREIKEYTVMKHFSNIYLKSPRQGDYISYEKIVMDVMDIVNEASLSDCLGDDEQPEDYHINLLVGELREDGSNSKALKLGVTFPCEDTNDEMIQQTLQSMVNLNERLTICEPHMTFMFHKLLKNSERGRDYVTLNFYYRFSKVFSSKGAMKNSFIKMVKVLDELGNHFSETGGN